MATEENARQLLDRWRQGDERAARMLVERYMVRLRALARSRLSRRLARRVEPDDIVLSAWRSFFVAAEKHRVESDDRGDLWPLLVTITLRKLARQAARHTAQRRDVAVEQPANAGDEWRELVSRDPGPEEAVAAVEAVEQLLQRLTPGDRDVVVLRLQGESQAEIAERLGCSERTVRRALERVREQVRQDHDDGDPWPEGLPRGVSSPGSAAAESIAEAAGTTDGWRDHSSARLPAPTCDYTDLLLHRLAGEGGFGRVYRATDRTTGETVAVKFLRKRFWRDRRAVQCLIHEQTIVAEISHSGIVPGRGWGTTPGGGTFLVLDWIDGQTAAAWTRAVNRPPAWQEVVECGIAVAEAVEAAHRAGIIHGDLTPGNILRRTDGLFVLTDFGFARSLSRPEHVPHGGTPGWLAPEQLCDAFGEPGVATDVYGLGGLLYGLLTGEPPLGGDDLPETLANVLSSRSASLPVSVRTAVPPGLVQLVERCLRKEPGERPEAAGAVAEQLREICQQG